MRRGGIIMRRMAGGIGMLLVGRVLAADDQDFFAVLAENRARGGHTYVNGTVNVAPLAGLTYAELAGGIRPAGPATVLEATRGPVAVVNIVARLDSPLVVWTEAGMGNSVLDVFTIRGQSQVAAGAPAALGAVVLGPGVQPRVINQHVNLAGLSVRPAPARVNPKSAEAHHPGRTGRGGHRD